MCLSRSSWLPNSLANLLPRTRRRFDCRLFEEVLVSRSASWSVLLVSSLVLTSCKSAFLFSSHCPVLVFVSPLVRAATVRHDSRRATLLVRALLLEPLISTTCSSIHVLTHVFFSWSAGCVTRLHVLLVVRWLRHPPSRSSRGPLVASPAFTFFSWSAGCITRLHILLVVRWLCHQPALSPPLRAARGVVAFFGAVAL